MNRVRFTRIAKVTSADDQREAERVAAYKSANWPCCTQWISNLDIFGYEPDYTFPGYRSRFGACVSVMLAMAVFLRVATRGIDYIIPDLKISENKLLFLVTSRPSSSSQRLVSSSSRQAGSHSMTQRTLRFAFSRASRSRLQLYLHRPRRPAMLLLMRTGASSRTKHAART